MFDHVTIRASDRDASVRFYTLVLRTIGIEPTHSGEHFVEWDDFSLAAANDETPVTRGLHIGFSAPSRADVDEFWRVGAGAGYRDDGAPGPRPQYGDTYYGGFLLDPDGNSTEAVHHDASARTAASTTCGSVWRTWTRRGAFTSSSRLTQASPCDAGRQSERSSSAPAGRSRSSWGPQPRICIWRFRSAPMRPLTNSIAPQRKPGTKTTAPPANGPSITPATTAPSCSIPTGTTWSS